MKEKSETVGLKLSLKKPEILAPSPITSWQIEAESVEAVRDFLSWAPQSLWVATAAIKLRHLLLARKAVTNLDSMLKSRDIILKTKIHIAKANIFPVVMYKHESRTVKKAEH